MYIFVKILKKAGNCYLRVFQKGFCKFESEVLNLSIGMLMNLCAKLNICTSHTPTSQSCKTLAVIGKAW